MVCLSVSMIHHLFLFFHKWLYSFILFLEKNRSYVHPILLVSLQSFNSSNPLFLKQNARLATSLASFARCSGHTIPLMKPLGNMRMSSVQTILPSLSLLLLPRISGRDSCLVGESCSIPFV